MKYIILILLFNLAHAQTPTPTPELDEKKLPWPYTNVCMMDINKVPVAYRAKVIEFKQRAGCK